MKDKGEEGSISLLLSAPIPPVQVPGGAPFQLQFLS